MSQKERDRLKVLHEAMKGHIVQREVAMQLENHRDSLTWKTKGTA